MSDSMQYREVINEYDRTKPRWVQLIEGSPRTKQEKAELKVMLDNIAVKKGPDYNNHFYLGEKKNARKTF